MSEGYPDYARLSQAGGFQLFASSGALPANTVLFEGYVGSWPYVNMFCDPTLGGEPTTVQLQWFSDSTFSTPVGFRNAVRTATNFSATQYSNLSPWLQLSFTNASGNPVSFDALSLYGTTAPATANQLLSADACIQQANSSLGAGATGTYNPQHVCFGPAILAVETPLATWFMRLQSLDASTWALKFQYRFSNLNMGGGGSVQVSLLDSPYQIDTHNTTGAAGSINWSLTLL